MVTKKRKDVEIIKDIDDSLVKKAAETPKCYGSKCDYCKKELCGEYFDSCPLYDSLDSL